jgi:glycosyltransferase involved in cell wall biosynthesis
VERADHVFVTSRTLESTWSAVRPVHYDPNCVDLTRFTAADDVDDDVLAHVPHPRIGFVGTLATYKLDVQLLLDLSDAEPGCSIVMIGPKEDGDRSLRQFLARPNVFHVEAQPYDDLPALMRTFAVGIIPARTDEYARSMFPMKFFEYLAAGIPVVSTNLPALRDYTAVAAVVDRADFVTAVRKVLDGDVPDASARRRACEENTYAARTTRMLAAIAGARASR